MRILSIGLILAACLGCQATAPLDYRELTDKIANGEAVSVKELRSQFLAKSDLPEQLERLTELESQALELIEDEPLKLGSIGSAILDIYYGSLTGHYAMTRFYAHLDNPEGATPHQQWLTSIREFMTTTGKGTREDPYPAMTGIEAQMFAISQDMTPVGSIYQAGDEIPFSLLIQAKADGQPIENLNFDLTSVFDAFRIDFRSNAEADTEFSPFSLIGLLAKRSDSAAQAAIGAFLASQNRFDDAVDWLRAASRGGNLLANTILARIYWEKASVTSNPAEKQAALDEVMENYLHAIALGSSDAMYALGVLYLNGHYGEENKSSGMTLLRQAADMNHSDAAMFLAHLYYVGEGVDRDLDAARSYYVKASELDNALAQRSYARFLLDPEANQPPDPRAVDWLTTLAKEQDDAEAMLLLGNLHARGVGAKQSFRKAVSWFKDAVKTSPKDPSIVNEVAWTLTVSDLEGLKRERYALSIMDKMMDADENARRRPEYLDTWAAAYAANGNFERAISLQEEALSVAEAQNFDTVLDVLREHLAAFKDQQTITERAP